MNAISPSSWKFTLNCTINVLIGSYRGGGAGRGINVSMTSPDDSAKKRRPGRRTAPDNAQEDENSLYSIIKQGKAGLQVLKDIRIIITEELT